MREKIKSVFDVINEEKDFEKLRSAAKNYGVIERFGDIFPELAKITKPVKVDKKVLYLNVENSVWRSELNLRRNLIIEKINSFFKEEIIKSVKFI